MSKRLRSPVNFREFITFSLNNWSKPCVLWKIFTSYLYILLYPYTFVRASCFSRFCIYLWFTVQFAIRVLFNVCFFLLNFSDYFICYYSHARFYFNSFLAFLNYYYNRKIYIGCLLVIGFFIFKFVQRFNDDASSSDNLHDLFDS